MQTILFLVSDGGSKSLGSRIDAWSQTDFDGVYIVYYTSFFSTYIIQGGFSTAPPPPPPKKKKFK